jgi:hypothetical protein
VSAHAITLGKIMNEKILEQLEVNQNKYEEQYNVLSKVNS